MFLLFFVQYLIPINWWPIYSGLPRRPIIASDVNDKLIWNLLEVSGMMFLSTFMFNNVNSTCSIFLIMNEWIFCIPFQYFVEAIKHETIQDQVLSEDSMVKIKTLLHNIIAQ